MSVTRQERYRQDNPRDQARSILGAAEGNLLNAQDSINTEVALKRAIEFIQEVQAILKEMPEGEWRG